MQHSILKNNNKNNNNHVFFIFIFKIEQCIIRPIVSYVTISYLLCITKKRHVALSIYLRAGTLLSCLNHNSPQSSFEVKSVITYTDHFFEYVLLSKTILKFFWSEIGEGEVWEGKIASPLSFLVNCFVCFRNL